MLSPAAALVVVLVICLLLAAYCLGCPPRQAGRPVRGGARGAKKKALPRGAEVDKAAGAAPVRVLEAGLPPGLWSAFDLVDGAVAPADWGVGLYVGLSNRDDPRRRTLMTPSLLGDAARLTSGRLYSWFVLDSYECCYAVRAAPREGKLFELDQAALVAWIRRELTGEPPHKLDVRKYVRYLRGAGLEVVTGRPRDSVARFVLVDVTTPAERESALKQLRALTSADFDALNWSDYDAKVHRAACESPTEFGGDAAIDLQRKRITVTKMRAGGLYMANPHNRSYVTFHTHPFARYRGNMYEPPSGSDVASVLAASQQGQVWHFVTAPEGTYILRPSSQLLLWHSEDPARAREAAVDLYMGSFPCRGGVAACARDAVQALQNAGFVAYFHEQRRRGVHLLDRPDLAPDANSLSAEQTAKSFDAARKLSGAQLLAADWLPILRVTDIPGLSTQNSWTTASWDQGALVPHRGHDFGDPADASSYTYLAGPIVVITFDPRHFPRAIPEAAIEAARVNSARWPWVAFLCREAVLVFRYTNGLEVYGPRSLAPARAARPPKTRGS